LLIFAAAPAPTSEAAAASARRLVKDFRNTCKQRLTGP
jgi:hypothetical protein